MESALLKELGFTKAASVLDEKKERARKMMIAYENYKFVTPEIFDRFNRELKAKTQKGYQFDRLAFSNIKDYQEVPPQHVLDKVKEAMGRGCFDTFEVAKVETVEVRPDPIIFGKINGCQDSFFIDQWDNDVKIEDILRENEG